MRMGGNSVDADSEVVNALRNERGGQLAAKNFPVSIDALTRSSVKSCSTSATALSAGLWTSSKLQ